MFSPLRIASSSESPPQQPTFFCCLTVQNQPNRFHVFDNHSPSVSSFSHHLDHLGIVILMWDAGISMIYYGFPCDARLRTTYWALMSCAAGSCAAVTLLPTFRTPQYHCWKIATYTSLGLTGLVFITHGLVMFGWETQNRRLPLLWVAGMAVTNLVGALIFAARVNTGTGIPSFPALDSSKYKLLNSLQIPETVVPAQV
jgi:predicted membrane channel-forming protein YqfA (hemolysin III family)